MKTTYRQFIRVLVLAGSLGWTEVLFSAELGTNDVQNSQGALTNGLATFQQLITASNFKLMGFNSTNEAATATVGPPIFIYEMPLDRLKAYAKSPNFAPLLEPRPEIMYPLTANQAVRSSITVRLRQGTWTTASWGQPNLIRDLMDAAAKVPSSIRFPDKPFQAVEMTVFGIWFLGYRDLQDQQVLLATTDIHRGALQINKFQVITPDMMYRFATLAQQYNGLPN
jgi:hypothetical protein